MKKINLLIFIFAITTIDVFSQGVSGKWYAVNRGGLIEFEFTNDSLKMSTLFADFRTKDSEKDAKRHAGIFKLNDKFIVVFPDQSKENNYRAMTLFNVKDKH